MTDLTCIQVSLIVAFVPLSDAAVNVRKMHYCYMHTFLYTNIQGTHAAFAGVLPDGSMPCSRAPGQCCSLLLPPSQCFCHRELNQNPSLSSLDQTGLLSFSVIKGTCTY